MAQTRGRVIGTDPNGWAEVLAEGNRSCGHCGTSSGCCSGGSRRRVTAKVLNRIDARSGDTVLISLETGRVLKNAALIYLIPVAGLMTGAVTGDYMGGIYHMDKTALSIGLGMIGLTAGFLVTAVISKFFTRRARHVPRIERIIESDRLT